MKKIIILTAIILFLNYNNLIAQSRYKYDENGNVIDGSNFKIKSNEKIILNDSINNIKYVLDEEHIMITALNLKGEILWKTDPWKDNKIEEYRTKRPKIVSFELGGPNYVDKLKKEKIVIWISYNNTQFGVLNRKGKFYFLGQD